MSVSVIALVGLSVLLGARPDARDPWAERDKAAKKACASGDYKEGVDILAGLYVDTEDPTYVYNQGRCYQQNHQWTSAIDRFREYLRKRPKAKPSERADVESHIAECEALRQRDVATAVPTGTLFPSEPLPAPPPPVPAPATSTVVTVVDSAPAATGAGTGLRVAGVILGAVGVAAVGAGFALNLKANSLAREFNRTHDPSTKDTQSSYKTGSMLGYAAGAGAVITGAVLYLLGRSRVPVTRESASLSFVPVSTGNGAIVGVRGDF